MSRSDIIARAIETQAWAALGVGDTLAYKNRRVSSERKAANILAALTDAGYRITAPDRLDAKTIEACAKVADAFDKLHAVHHGMGGDPLEMNMTATVAYVEEQTQAEQDGTLGRRAFHRKTIG